MLGVFILKNLAALRKKSGLTQEKLAEKANLSQQTISRYERGQKKPKYENLKFLADFFGVSIDYLLDRPESEAFDEIFELREYLRERPEMRTLIDRSKAVNEADIKKLIGIMESLKNK